MYVSIIFMTHVSSSQIFLKVTLVIFLGGQPVRNHPLLAAPRLPRTQRSPKLGGINAGVPSLMLPAHCSEHLPPGVR